MIIKILGLLDILSAFSFWLFAFFGFPPKSLIMLFAFYLLVKGVIFLISADIASILDIISAGIIFLSFSFALPKFLVILVTLFLIQKGIFSLIS
jgi:hypothetical protein